MVEPVRLYEVSLRDGLQNEAATVPTEAKLQLLDRLIASGLTDIEVTSFVRWIPQLADADALVRALPARPGVRFWALVPNRVGYERAVDAGIRNVGTVLSASETHNRKNVNRTVAESLSGLKQVISEASSNGLRVRAYISTAFGCPYEGVVPIDRSRWLAQALLATGATEIVLGDTIGLADPTLVQATVAALEADGVPPSRIALHLHDTRGTALVNAWAGWLAGVRTFDGSVGGVGGCPYAPGAAGNAATEDLAQMFGHFAHTGLDLDGLCVAATELERHLGRPLTGRYLRAWASARERSVERALCATSTGGTVTEPACAPP
jgi:hydroxymethylglutaryl-CoA lyase